MAQAAEAITSAAFVFSPLRAAPPDCPHSGSRVIPLPTAPEADEDARRHPFFQEAALHCRHVLIGRAELDTLEADATARADALSDQADRIAQLERAIHDHRTAGTLADTDEQYAAADDRLWGVLDV